MGGGLRSPRAPKDALGVYGSMRPTTHCRPSRGSPQCAKHAQPTPAADSPLLPAGDPPMAPISRLLRQAGDSVVEFSKRPQTKSTSLRQKKINFFLSLIHSHTSQIGNMTNFNKI
ncbi:hypothetical protein O3G_MSEX009694 [Manduca sexta]|uniref:Uncharacterized protein n=1 Tax=Manduca sexta TaxID=7130 RepID=A0A921ZEZ4_MANSE|nr:hypothetical protein O3G_MSEX009694 [Manduca sexta]